MLKNIRLHLEKDENQQAKLDAQLASHILQTHHDNINAFMRHIPSLLPYVENPKLDNFSVFINKDGQHNIVDYGMGRTFYGFAPEQEVLAQYQQISQHCPQIQLTQTQVSSYNEPEDINSLEQLSSMQKLQTMPALPKEVECLVVLGCGLGLHLKHLLSQHKIKNLIIYEPELQYFQCSVMTTAWHDILSLAKAQGCALFLQLEKDGRDLIKDINELVEHFAIKDFYLYKHYNHQVFDSLYQDLTERSWKAIQDAGFSIQSEAQHLDYLPSWTPVNQPKNQQLLTPPNTLFEQNLAALKRYFPDIYAEFCDYQPKKWLPVSQANGEVNVIKKDSLHAWYSESPKQDCIVNFENFNEQPNKDGLVLGYKGNKLAHYIHYQFVKQTEELLAEAEEEVGALPDTVPSIIMFGLGVGYQLEKLLQDHTVEKLFICEPNPDFFYASLFAIDWQHIFATVEQSDSRIYLNIGDDGSNLFRDLLSQFYSIGPYLLNSTYFYQSYYNASLNSAITQLREQLQVVISMGEYFDHAYYGIAHTTEGMRRKLPILTANPASQLNYDDKEVPIFIVGNGPSLDSSIEAIKEWQEQAIVVSCGTALQALHRHGITPDFHAEIEQNRSTYDWAVLIGDLDYLKKITLISCNGIHPDTCDLYKDVMIAFKEGESSTISALNVLGRENYQVLQNAFPTVSNFVCDLFSTIGFTSIYLIGVDLGFVDVKHHHSKSSGYYQDDGQETYNYQDSANTSLVVPGNFRPKVNTKHEFKVSRQVIEQVTNAKPKGQEFYNCSDGAKIAGTLPLRPSELLIVSDAKQKNLVTEKLVRIVFSNSLLQNYLEKFNRLYSQDLLKQELNKFELLLTQKVSTNKQADWLIKHQKEMLFDSFKNGHSLLFYYLYGTVNYANAVLTKLLFSVSTTEVPSKTFQDAKSKWQSNFAKIKRLISANKIENFDISSYNKVTRQLINMEYSCPDPSVIIVTDSIKFTESFKHILTTEFSWINKVKIINHTDICTEVYEKPDFIIYQNQCLSNVPIKGKKNTILMVNDQEPLPTTFNGFTYFKVLEIEDDNLFINPISLARSALNASFNTNKCSLVMPKYIVSENIQLGAASLNFPKHNFTAFDFSYFIGFYAEKNSHCAHGLLNNGSRAVELLEQLKLKDLFYMSMSENDYQTHKYMATKLINSKLKGN
ncbi:motility associated factor glycosyltransferase family protein [Paraglaciecola aestuariivivens]